MWFPQFEHVCHMLSELNVNGCACVHDWRFTRVGNWGDLFKICKHLKPWSFPNPPWLWVVTIWGVLFCGFKCTFLGLHVLVSDSFWVLLVCWYGCVTRSRWENMGGCASTGFLQPARAPLKQQRFPVLYVFRNVTSALIPLSPQQAIVTRIASGSPPRFLAVKISVPNTSL